MEGTRSYAYETDKNVFFNNIRTQLKHTHFVIVKAPKNVTLDEFVKEFSNEFRTVSKKQVCDHSCKLDCCYKQGSCSCRSQDDNDNNNKNNNDRGECVCNGYYCGHNEICSDKCNKNLFFTIELNEHFCNTVARSSNLDILAYLRCTCLS